MGARGAARLLGVIPVPAVVTAKEAGRSWTWRVGPVDMVHAVRPDGGGCQVEVELHAPAPVEALLAPHGARGAAAELGAALQEVPGARLAHAAVSGALTG